VALTVVQLLPALDAGGVERGTVEVSAELVRNGHRAIVVSAGGRLLKELLQCGAEHVPLPIGRKSPLTLLQVPGLRRLLIRTGADIVHARSRLPAWIGYLAWRSMPESARPRFVTTVHGRYRPNGYSRIMTRGERIIAVSDSIRDYILHNYPATDPARITVIPRGVDPLRFARGYRPPAGWQRIFFERNPELRDWPLILFPARVTRRKGHESFVRFMAGLRDRSVDARGVVVGGAAPRHARYLAELRARITAADLDDRVSVLGHRDDLRELMAISSLVLSLSSEPEAFGRTVLEALALGIPVVGYAHGGTAEVLARLYPEGAVTPGDLAAAIDLAERLLRHAPPVAASNPFTLQRMLDGTLDTYQSLAASRP